MFIHNMTRFFKALPFVLLFSSAVFAAAETVAIEKTPTPTLAPVLKKVVPATNEIVVIILNDKPGSITRFPAFSNPTETP